ncbi:MAG: hypothetical protein Udaeo_16090 [Candidatus Udaeobacter sp.]|nr:MAG: hypothetical protein Udaeo_16090 [Candidatus Udaeobacter sp.]
MLTEANGSTLLHGDGAPPRGFVKSQRDEGVAAPITSCSSHSSMTTGVPSSTILNNSITSSLRILTQP